MKKLLFVVAAMTAAVCAAYTQAPGMKTPWGEKVTPENAWREYPRPQMVRDAWTNLNGLWQYAVTKDAPGFPANWDGEILVPFVIESSLSGVGRELGPRETLWYRRTFNADVKPGTRLLLHFEQADFRAQVFINRVEIDIPHEGGQMPFSFDVTDYVKAGSNELVVSIWDPTVDFLGSTGKQTFKSHGCMYTRSSGIGGTVWMEAVPETHLTDYKIVTDIDAGTVAVTLEGTGNLLKASGKVEVCRNGKTLASGELTTWGKPVTVKLPTPVALWSPETPELYDLRITFADGATGVKDVVKGYFGMRKFEMKKDPNDVLRFYFNNKARFIIGTLDQGWWPDGLLTPPSEEAMEFDILQLKKMGYDMMRKHIKVEPRRYYYLCDKLGIIVLQDMPSGAFDTLKRYGFYRHELKQMMDHLQKTPSIVMWIPYNEGWGQPGQYLTHSTLMWTQRYDTTRLVNGPSGAHDFEGGEVWGKDGRLTKHLPPEEEEAAHTIDKHDYGRTPSMFPVNDRRASFLGEFGGIGCRVEGHLWTKDAWGYGGTGNMVDRKAVQDKFVTLMMHVGSLARMGLTGCVYTQTTDVEAEINGLITYDRKVIKFDPEAIATVHARVRAMAENGLIRTEKKEICPIRDPDASAWAYTFEEPAANWAKSSFNDAAWQRSAGGFGSNGIEERHRTAKVVTSWSTKNLWVRRHFNYEGTPDKLIDVVLNMFHDEDVEIFLNGEPIFSAAGFTTDYAMFSVLPEVFTKAVKKGDNVLAVKVTQTTGAQFFDLGLMLEIAK